MEPLNKNEEVNWKAELKKTALKYHLIACWVAIIVNPLWTIVDYYTAPQHWKTFLILRALVTVFTLSAVIGKKFFINKPELLAFIPFVGITTQNAYIYSVMDLEGFRSFTFGYLALFIGAGMLILWHYWYSVAIVVISLIVSIACFISFSPLTLDQILVNGGFLTFSVALFTIVLINTRYNLTKREIIARLTLAESNLLLEQQKTIIEVKNKDITDSIKYAKQIQEAILPSDDHLRSHVSDAFILFKPKDIVSGDFYWYSVKGDSLLIAAADCTGHGVPGALMSMLGSSFLNEIVNEKEIFKPSDILSEIRSRIVKILQQKNSASNSKDGMDIALINLNLKTKELQYAGAFNPLWIARGEEMLEVKADKFPIGNYIGEAGAVFTNHTLPVIEGDVIYLFSDGYADQFGGPKGKKFKYKQLKEKVLQIKNESMPVQKKILDTSIGEWAGMLEQVDDILMIGIRV